MEVRKCRQARTEISPKGRHLFRKERKLFPSRTDFCSVTAEFFPNVGTNFLLCVKDIQTKMKYVQTIFENRLDVFLDTYILMGSSKN